MMALDEGEGVIIPFAARYDVVDMTAEAERWGSPDAHGFSSFRGL